VGSLIQPSIGMALSGLPVRCIPSIHTSNHTFVENIAHGAVVQNSHPTQIRLNATQILYVRAVPESAVLSIIPPLKEFSLLLQPIDNRVGVFLHAGGEHDELVPLADFAKEFVAMRTFVDVIEDGMLWADYRGVGGGAESNRRIELDFYHVPGGHSTAFGEGVN